MAAPNKFNLFVEDILKGNCNLASGGDTIKCMLSNTLPVATNHVYANITEIAAGNGYTTGGIACTGTSLSNASGTETFACNAVTWTSITGNMATFRYIIYYDSTPATQTLITWYDYGGTITLNGAAGDTFTASPTGNVLFTLA